MRSVAGAVDWFEAQSASTRPAPTPTGSWLGWCLMAVRMGAGIPALYPSADTAWSHTRFRSGPVARPPAGWFVWWDRPGNPATDADHGHVAYSAGDGLVWSTDARRRGRIDLVRLASITDRWGMPYVGCSRDLNGVLHVPRPTPTKPRPDGETVKVRAGDTISELVAHHAPLVPWAEVWNDPHNRGLRARRRRPELVRPGDRLWVP